MIPFLHRHVTLSFDSAETDCAFVRAIVPNCEESSIRAELLQQEVKMPLLHNLTAVLQDPKQRRIVDPIKDSPEQN